MPVKKNVKSRNAKDVLKESTPAGGGFASFFSLQAGSVMAASIIFGIAFTSFIYNLSAPNPTVDTRQYSSQYAIAYLFFVVIFFGTIAVSIAAFKFNALWVLIGACVLAVAAGIWLIISILSFIPFIEVCKYVCVHERCPPTVWLFEVSWRPRPTDVVSNHDRMKDDGTTQNTTDIGVLGRWGGGASSTTTIHTITTTIIAEEGKSTSGTFGYGNATALDGNAISERSTEGGAPLTGAVTEGRTPLEMKMAKRFAEGSVERPRAFADFEYYSEKKENANGTKLWGWFPVSWNVDKRRVKPFVSSYVRQDSQPGEPDSTIGMSIFCFIMLILFWVYSLWTMFSHHKELKKLEEDEARSWRA